MMKISVTPLTLCTLLAPCFTLEAVEALCNYFEDVGDDTFAPMLDNIWASYSEQPAEYADEYEEENIIAWLKNGNILVAN